MHVQIRNYIQVATTVSFLVAGTAPALSNAIIHGNKRNENLKVHVRIYISSRRIVIQVEDQGGGFLTEEIEDPTREQNLYKGSGRGIFLIKELMDGVRFQKGGRVIEMEKANPFGAG